MDCDGPSEKKSHDRIVQFLEEFFRHMTVIRLSHFATDSYAIHKATDCYLCKLNANFDKFMEVAQGAMKKLQVIAVSKSFGTLSA